MQKLKKDIFTFFDKLEDKVRASLSRRPIIYALIGGVGIVLFWRGIWMTADLFPALNGPVSIIISVLILLATGLFVSFFIGDIIILSGIKRDKKVIEKTEQELQSESELVGKIKDEVVSVHKEIQELKQEIHNEHKK